MFHARGPAAAKDRSPSDDVVRGTATELDAEYNRRSGHDEMYQVPYARTNVYKYSFFPAMYACGTLYLHL